MRHGESEGLRQLAHGSKVAVFAVFMTQYMFLRRWQEGQALLRRTPSPAGPIEAVEEAAADLVLLEHGGDSLFLVEGRASGASILRVGRERRLEFLSEAQI